MVPKYLKESFRAQVAACPELTAPEREAFFRCIDNPVSALGEQNPTAGLGQVIRYRDAARRLGVCPDRIHQLVKAGRLVAVRQGPNGRAVGVTRESLAAIVGGC